MRMMRIFAGFVTLALLSGAVSAQPAAPPSQPAAPPPLPAPSTDPALSLEANAKFLAENLTKPGVMRRPSGLQYKILRNGFGKHPQRTDTVEVYYTGSLITGKVFDGTSAGLPASMNLTASAPVQGFLEALLLMREGDSWQIWIPAPLGYGVRGAAGGKIPPNQTLVFEVRLLTAAAPKRGEPGYVPPAGEKPQ